MLDDARAVAIARRMLGDDALAATVPYLQEAALPRGIRNVLEDQHVDLDDVRDSLSSTLGVEQQPLVKLRRVSLGSVLNLALLALAAYTMIALIGGVDLNTFIEEVRDASWPWLLWGLIIAQLARVPNAVSTIGAVRRPVPLGPLVLLQFAICYINLAIPASAARVAVNVRFLQRFGIPATAAMSAGAIDSVSGFIVQIVLVPPRVRGVRRHAVVLHRPVRQRRVPHDHRHRDRRRPGRRRHRAGAQAQVAGGGACAWCTTCAIRCGCCAAR